MAVHHTPGHVRLRLRLAAGWIHISTGESDETRVEIIPLNEDPAAREAAAAIHEESSRRGDVYEVTVESPERARRFLLFGRDAQIGIEITAPAGADVEASVASADVTGTGSFGDVTVNSASGDITFERVGGRATVKTASGDVRLSEASQGADVKTASGDIAIDKVSEQLRISSVSGDLDASDVAGSTHAATVSGDIRIRRAAPGDATLRSVSGDMVFDVQPGSSVWMDVSSLSGTTSSDLELGSDAPPANGADIELRASSVSGDIRITRGHERAPAGF
jgi:DUF4097 and DUF4098 domain-containing protein YvlB